MKKTITIIGLLVALTATAQQNSDSLAGSYLKRAGANMEAGMGITIATNVLGGVLMLSGAGTPVGAVLIIGNITGIGVFMSGFGHVRRAGEVMESGKVAK